MGVIAQEQEQQQQVSITRRRRMAGVDRLATLKISKDARGGKDGSALLSEPHTSWHGGSAARVVCFVLCYNMVPFFLLSSECMLCQCVHAWTLTVKAFSFI
jgi:hypothetical protein